VIFIDTGAFLARYAAGDQHHAEAVFLWGELESGPARFFTSNMVLVETFTLLARRTTYAFASERAHNIYHSERLTILRPEANDEVEALSVFQKYSEVAVSFTDAVSCVLMRRHRLKRVFSFDRHFEDMGFSLLKRR